MHTQINKESQFTLHPKKHEKICLYIFVVAFIPHYFLSEKEVVLYNSKISDDIFIETSALI